MSPRTARRVGVVGAGILGLATARALGLRDPGARVTVLDKEQRIGAHQTSHNSGVVHAGLYYVPGSLKARLCRQGLIMLRDYCHDRGLPYQECGKVVVAVDDEEIARLDALEERGRANGVEGLRRLGPYELRGVEPHAVGKAALLSPRTAITDFAAVARAYADDLRAAGGEVVLGAEVVAVRERAGTVRVITTAGEHEFAQLLVCAGLHSDHLAQLCGDGPDPRYPFLGVHLTRRVDGEVLVGPNAVLAFAREGYRFARVHGGDLAGTLRWPGFRRLAREHWRTGLAELHRSLRRAAFVRAAQRYVPDLQPSDVVPGPSGVRAQAVAADGSLVDDFRISHRGAIVNIRNAPSPAATSSLAIAEHIADLVAG